MFPLPVLGIGFAVFAFLGRSNIGGLLMGAFLVLAAMHIWPGSMDAPYQWVGQILDAIGLDEIMGTSPQEGGRSASR